MSLFNKDGKIVISPSQLINFENCERFWWWNKIQKKETVKTKALFEGSQFHSCLEESFVLLKENFDLEAIRKILLEKFDKKTVDLVIAGWNKKILKLPRVFLVEQDIKVPIEDIGIMKGKIDFYNVSDHKIEDHKTVSMWKYALTEQGLRENLQLLVYSYWSLYKLPKKDCITVRHNQFFKPNPEESKYVETTVYRKDLEEFWENRIIPTTKKMIECSKIVDEKDETNVKCNLKFCGAYNGCSFKGFCKGGNCGK